MVEGGLAVAGAEAGAGLPPQRQGQRSGDRPESGFLKQAGGQAAQPARTALQKPQFSPKPNHKL